MTDSIDSSQHIQPIITSSDDSLTDDESSELDLDDQKEIQLLRLMDREDLFFYVKSNPVYYLSLIHEHQLGPELNILVRRTQEGILNIKFRIYPEDKWTEVGYFSDAPDENIYNDFRTEVGLQLSKTRNLADPLTVADEHLNFQLAGLNDMCQTGYGLDLPQTSQQSPELSRRPSVPMSSFERSACQRMEMLKKNTSTNQPSTSQRPKLSISSPPKQKPTGHRRPENLKDEVRKHQLKDQPMEMLNTFIAGLLEKIQSRLPYLVQVDLDKNYQFSVIRKLQDLKPPAAYQTAHQELIAKAQGCEYLNKLHRVVDWEQLPELDQALTSFQQTALKMNPSFYLKLTPEKLDQILDEDDQQILKKYNLNVQQLWKDYLLSEEMDHPGC